VLALTDEGLARLAIAATQVNDGFANERHKLTWSPKIAKTADVIDPLATVKSLKRGDVVPGIRKGAGGGPTIPAG
jgi:hypothetical protein